MALEEMSPGAQETIKKEVGSARLGEIDKTFDGAETYFEVTVNRDGVERTFDVAENGALESRQVFLTEIPAPAQAAIQQSIGTGTIVEIDQVFDGRKHTFDIEGLKDGKPFNFSVGPKGKFLGMDQ